jgi:hypothetical protein
MISSILISLDILISSNVEVPASGSVASPELINGLEKVLSANGVKAREDLSESLVDGLSQAH